MEEERGAGRLAEPGRPKTGSAGDPVSSVPTLAEQGSILEVNELRMRARWKLCRLLLAVERGQVPRT
jgi:hypothetical protein